MLDVTERYDVPPEDRRIAIRDVLEHPTVWCQIGDDQQSLEWWAGKEGVMRWEKGKGMPILRE